MTEDDSEETKEHFLVFSLSCVLINPDRKPTGRQDQLTAPQNNFKLLGVRAAGPQSSTGSTSEPGSRNVPEPPASALWRSTDEEAGAGEQVSSVLSGGC